MKPIQLKKQDVMNTKLKYYKTYICNKIYFRKIGPFAYEVNFLAIDNKYQFVDDKEKILDYL